MISIFIVGLFDSSIMDLFKNSVLLNTDSLKLLIVLAILLYLLIIGLMNIMCKKVFNKGVNVE